MWYDFKRLLKLILCFSFLFALSDCGGGGGGGGNNADTITRDSGDFSIPTVSSTSPSNGATGVYINTAITVTFSEAMNASTITTATFTVADAGGTGTGTITYSGTTATWTPSSNLAYSTTYTATITSDVRDAAGNYMASNYTWCFTTGTESDTTAPMVSSTSPSNGATGVAINTAITVTFSEAMNASTITTATFTVADAGGAVTGTIAYSGTTATWKPSSNLAYSTTYTATITSDVRDAAGNAMASNYTWSFTTGAAGTALDTTAPMVISIIPSNVATGVAINIVITVTFSETMTASTITTATFTVTGVTGAVAGTITYSGTTATFTPSANLVHNTPYTVMITAGVKDAAGNAMASSYTWSFTITANIRLTWNAPTTNEDGTDLLDLAGYKIYYGTSSGSYTTTIDVGNVTTYTFSNLSPAIYCFVITAYNTMNNESGYSTEKCLYSIS